MPLAIPGIALISQYESLTLIVARPYQGRPRTTVFVTAPIE